jgi:hypothetical protein
LRRNSREQSGQSVAGIGLAHEAFSDEEGIESGLAEAGDIAGGCNATLRDADGARRNAFDECEGDFRVNFESPQIAIVDANGVIFGVVQGAENFVELLGRVHFDENVEAQRMCEGGEALQLSATERGGDEEDSVSAVGAGFDDLVLVDDEVFAEAGDLCRG